MISNKIGSVPASSSPTTDPVGRHTPAHVDCPACKLLRARVLESLEPGMFFEAAGELYLRLREVSTAYGMLNAQFVRPSTLRADKRQIASLELFFKGMPLGEIGWHHIRAYQQARVAGTDPFLRYRRPHDSKDSADGTRKAKGKTPCPAKPAQVNQEIGLLKRIKTLAGCWTDEDKRYHRNLLETEEEPQRALTPEEQAHWLDVARSKERWSLVYWYSVIAFDTCASTNELRALRIGDIVVEHSRIQVPWPGAKNRFRHRSITVEDNKTLWALDRLLDRAQSLGAVEPHHFLFPFRKRREEWDKEKPMSGSGLKRMWNEVRDESGLTWFRPYDTRHTAATRLAEAGVPVDVIVARMGHCDDRMRRIYTHISESAQRRWMRFAREQARTIPIRRNDISEIANHYAQSTDTGMRFGPERVPFVPQKNSRFFS